MMPTPMALTNQPKTASRMDVFVDSNGDGVSTAANLYYDRRKGQVCDSWPPGWKHLDLRDSAGRLDTNSGFTDHQSVTVRDGKETRVKFPNITAPVLTGRINGNVFEDLNENGIREPGEDGLEAGRSSLIPMATALFRPAIL